MFGGRRIRRILGWPCVGEVTGPGAQGDNGTPRTRRRVGPTLRRGLRPAERESAGTLFGVLRTARERVRALLWAVYGVMWDQ